MEGSFRFLAFLLFALYKAGTSTNYNIVQKGYCATDWVYPDIDSRDSGGKAILLNGWADADLNVCFDRCMALDKYYILVYANLKCYCSTGITCQEPTDAEKSWIYSYDTCSYSCKTNNDGTCDDGGNGSSYVECQYGTDCADCGLRPLPITEPYRISTGVCPSRISSIQECETAATLLNLKSKKVRSQSSQMTDPIGCYEEGAGLHFNDNKDSSGNCSSGDVCVCNPTHTFVTFMIELRGVSKVQIENNLRKFEEIIAFALGLRPRLVRILRVDIIESVRRRLLDAPSLRIIYTVVVEDLPVALTSVTNLMKSSNFSHVIETNILKDILNGTSTNTISVKTTGEPYVDSSVSRDVPASLETNTDQPGVIVGIVLAVLLILYLSVLGWRVKVVREKLPQTTLAELLKLAAFPCINPSGRDTESQCEMPTSKKPKSTTEVITAKTSQTKTASDAPTISVKVPSGPKSVIGPRDSTQNPFFAKPKPNPLIASGGFQHA